MEEEDAKAIYVYIHRTRDGELEIINEEDAAGRLATGELIWQGLVNPACKFCGMEGATVQGTRFGNSVIPTCAGCCGVVEDKVLSMHITLPGDRTGEILESSEE